MSTPAYIRSEPRVFAEVGLGHHDAYRCVLADLSAFSPHDGLGWVAACLMELPGALSREVMVALAPGKLDVLDDQLPDGGGPI
jgi:hypothetical protein